MGSTPAWFTLLAAILGSAITAAATIGAQWVAAVRAVRLAEVERDRRRDEQADQRREDARRLREESYAAFLAAARELRLALRSATDVRVPIAAIQQAAATIELRSPAVADGPLVTVLDAADRLVAVHLAHGPGPVVAEAAAEFDHAMTALRQAMRSEVDA